MKTLANFFNPLLNENCESSEAKYEVIENETLKSSNLKDLNISGSLFSLTTFMGVTFESCVFFGSKMENCKFINCKFINCSFQFTNISYCNFNATRFENCLWDLSPIKSSEFHHCEMGVKTTYFASQDNNSINSCYSNEAITWEEVLQAPSLEDSNQDEVVAQIVEYPTSATTTQQDESATLTFVDAVWGLLDKIAA